MRQFIIATVFALSLAPAATLAQPAPAPAAPAHYTTSDTPVGTLLDDPAARAIVDKYLAGFSQKPNIDQGRSLTLRAMQQYDSNYVTDTALANIDIDLSKLPAKK